jgi:hypothetical protein
MTALRSSNLASADYDEETRTLTVTFKSGSVYTYHDADEGTYQGLLSAASPGAYFAANIKDKLSFSKG